MTKARTNVLYFCDESHIRSSDFIAVGGLAVPARSAARVEDQISKIRERHGYAGRTTEIQWKSASPRKDDIFRAYVDLLFWLIENDKVHVHIRFTGSDGTSMKPENVSKSFYQLLLHRAGRYYHARHSILVRPDNGCCTNYLPNMHVGLNNDIMKKFSASERIVRDISPQDSRKHPILQLLDVTLGALTCIRNGRHLTGAVGDYKKGLAEHTLEKCPVKEITKNTNLPKRKFSIWNAK